MLSAQAMMNWFLYGRATTPTNLIDESLIRPDNAAPLIPVDATAYMADAGRFFTGCSFPLVTDFFQDADLPPGTYTKTDLAARYNMSFVGLSLQEGNFDDGNGDYGERTFVWGSVAFQIADGALFVVDPDGKKHIDNFAVQPLAKQNDLWSSDGGCGRPRATSARRARSFAIRCESVSHRGNNRGKRDIFQQF